MHLYPNTQSHKNNATLKRLCHRCVQAITFRSYSFITMARSGLQTTAAPDCQWYNLRFDICITAIQHWGESSMYFILFIYLWIYLSIYSFYLFIYLFFFFLGGADLNKAYIKQFSCPCIFIALRSNLAYGSTNLQFISFIIDFIIAELSCLSFIHWRNNYCVISNVVTSVQ